MAKRGKRYRAATAELDLERLYTPQEALALVKERAWANFDETVEVAIRLGVDVRHADQMVRGTVVLPNGTGRQVRVLAFAKGEKAQEARDAGADFVGDDDLAAKIQGGWLDFDVAVATPDMMSLVGRMGKILGPRGLMPNPKSGTVTFDVAQAVKEVKAGKVEFRTDRGGVVHVALGKVSFDVEQLLENFFTLTDALVKSKPASAKGQYVRSITIAASMGPGLRIHPHHAVSAA